LTVPAQPLQAFGLHVVGEPFCAADFCLGHDGTQLDESDGLRDCCCESYEGC
jgi:hypothetical protein